MGALPPHAWGCTAGRRESLAGAGMPGMAEAGIETAGLRDTGNGGIPGRRGHPGPMAPRALLGRGGAKDERWKRL